MDLFTDNKTSHPQVSELSNQLASLVDVLNKLKDENRSLRNQQNQLIAERASLLEKNEIARTRVENMITRLKSMEESAK